MACWDIENCSTGVSLPQKGEVASLLKLSFLLLQAELWPQADFAGLGGRERERAFWLGPKCPFPALSQQGKVTI